MPLGKNLFRRRQTVRDALLVGIEQQLLPGRPVLFDAERERVAVEHVAHAPRIVGQPGQRIARHRRIEQALDAAPLRFQEGVVEIARNPGIGVDDVLLHRDDVHDRPDLGAGVVLLVHLQKVGKQPMDVGMALQEAVRRPGDDGAVDLAGGEQLAEGLVGDAGDLDAGWQVELDLLDAAGLVGAGLIPVHLRQLDADLVVEPAAHVDRRCVGPFRRTDALAPEVVDGLDAAVPVYVERREAKHARAGDGQADDVGIVARYLGGELGEGKLAHVPFAIEGEAGEYLVMAEGEPGVVDALRLDGTEAEVAKMVVVSGCDGESDAVHCFPPVLSALCRRSYVLACRSYNLTKSMESTQ